MDVIECVAISFSDAEVIQGDGRDGLSSKEIGVPELSPEAEELRSISSLSTLIKKLREDFIVENGQYDLTGNMDESVSHELQRYAATVEVFDNTSDISVTNMKTISDGTLFYLVHMQGMMKPLFPNLHTLCLTQTTTSRFPHLVLFTSPSLARVELSDNDQTSNLPVVLFLQRQRRYHSVTEMILHRIRLSSGAFKTISTLHQLKHLELRDVSGSSDASDLKRLFDIPHLSYLGLGIQSMEYTPTFQPSKAKFFSARKEDLRVHESLKTFIFEGDLTALLDLRDNIVSARLKTLAIRLPGIADFHGRTTINVVETVLKKKPGFIKMQEHQVINTKTVTNPLWVLLTDIVSYLSGSLQSLALLLHDRAIHGASAKGIYYDLYRLRALTSLHLKGFPLPKEFTWTPSRYYWRRSEPPWPKIRYLRFELGLGSSSGGSFYDPNLPFDVLDYVAKSYPNIEFFEGPVGLPTFPMLHDDNLEEGIHHYDLDAFKSIKINPSLTTLSIGTYNSKSRCEVDIRVAEYLTLYLQQMFPNLQKVIPHPLYEGKFWNRVEALLQMHRKIREMNQTPSQ
ncbi:hypothetical protein CPC08DRAFT_760422 [Agrocybe pediades]|nr:hypothetical protein CPC08DRAFT_760422 [Agrocybe pediades]